MESDEKTTLGKLQDVRDTLLGQIGQFAKWNEEHLKVEPEQCRKNIETMVTGVKVLSELRV